jgi:hypothetical protein
LGPLALVHEVTIRALYALDLVQVLEARDACIERIQPLGCGLRERRAGGGEHHRSQGCARRRA